MRKSKTSVKIHTMDLCQTPGYAVEPLIQGVWIDEGMSVWECASGEGYLSNALRPHFRRVFESDCGSNRAGIIQHDFIGEYRPWVSWKDIHTIITNPPFSKKKEFVTRALEYRKQYKPNMEYDFFELRVAFLLQSEVVSTKWFGEIVKEHGNPGIIWFNPRVNFKMPNKGWKGAGSHFSTAWFTWGWFTGNKFIRMSHWTKEYRERFQK